MVSLVLMISQHVLMILQNVLTNTTACSDHITSCFYDTCFDDTTICAVLMIPQHVLMIPQSVFFFFFIIQHVLIISQHVFLIPQYVLMIPQHVFMIWCEGLVSTGMNLLIICS